MLDLEKKHLSEIISILRERVPNCDVHAFGSRVSGKSGKFSDLDLVIKGQSELDLKTIIRLKEAFRESDLPFKVDVLDWLAISDDFRNRIKDDRVIIQERIDA